jgi:L-cysteine S-thiosulfotransferase
MNKKWIAFAVGAVALAGAGCATVMSEQEKQEKAQAMMAASFKERGQAKLDRLKQDETLALCSQYSGQELPKDVAKKIEETNFASIKYPADGKMMGDWKEGERIAQTGVGKQFSDDPSRPSGGNCYACHKLDPKELSYGTIGVSLEKFGKLRGNSEAIQKYTWGKIWNAQAFSACSNMPRFGHNRILTEAQIKHLVALLLDPESPVNK